MTISGRRINQNVYSLISPYISYIDHVNFIKSFPFLKIKYPKNIILIHIIEQLQRMGLRKEQISKMFEVMKRNDIVISGSFVLSILLGNYYQGQDIDFYRLYKKEDYDDDNSMFEELFEYYDVKFSNEYDFDKYCYSSTYRNRSKYLVNNKVCVNYLYIVPNDEIVYDNVKDYINILFDFNFCKNVIDFNSKDLISIYDIDSLINKSCNFSVSKYVSRNYNQHLIDMSVNMYNIITNNIEKRKRKYRQRGFTINQSR